MKHLSLLEKANRSRTGFCKMLITRMVYLFWKQPMFDYDSPLNITANTLIESGEINYYFQEFLPNGDPWLSYAKDGDSYIIRFHNLADFKFHPENKEIKCFPIRDIQRNTIEHFYYSQIIPLVNSYYGQTIIHASAVVINSTHTSSMEGRQEAIAFIGESGQGKSTLTLSFCKAGFPVLTDDCLVVESEQGRVIGYPSQEPVRLWPDSAHYFYGQDCSAFEPITEYSMKKRVGFDQGRIALFHHPVPIRRVYFLNNSDEIDHTAEIEIKALSPQESFLKLVQNVFRLEITDKKRIRQEFESLTQLSLFPVFYHLSYPRRYDRLPDVQRAVLEHFISQDHLK